MKKMPLKAALLGAAMAITPAANAQVDPLIGEIRSFAFSFCPHNWAPANGALLSISSYGALYSLYGTTYGGDGITTFALPNLSYRTPVHNGTGTGLTTRPLGQLLGEEFTTDIIQHKHALIATNDTANSNDILGAHFATINFAGVNAWATDAPTVIMNSQSIEPAGINNYYTEENVMPSQSMLFCVSLNGTYPSFN